MGAKTKAANSSLWLHVCAQRPQYEHYQQVPGEGHLNRKDPLLPQSHFSQPRHLHSVEDHYRFLTLTVETNAAALCDCL